MSKNYRVAIIGYGKMGKIRAGCVRQHRDCEIVGICDVNRPEQSDGFPFVSDFKKIADFKPDIVFVCTFNKFIPEIVSFYLNRGVHVFCEKPPGRSTDDVKVMLKAQEANPGIKLKFGFNHRYHQAVLDAKAIVDKKRLGRVMWVRGIYGKGGGVQFDQSWRNKKELSGGGILIDQGIHMVDLFRMFCGDFQEVKSFVGQSYWPVEVEDNAFVILRNFNGQMGMLHSSATQWHYKFLFDIYMEKGYMSIEGILSSSRNYGTETLKIARCLYDRQGYPMPNPQETKTLYDEDKSWDLELEEFINCIKSDNAIQVGSCQEAYQTLHLIERIYRADERWSKDNLKTKEEVTYEDSRLVK